MIRSRWGRGAARKRLSELGEIAMKALSAVAFGAALLLVSAPSTAGPVDAQQKYGAFGPEGARLREQLWILPSGDAETPLRATVFRPVDPPGTKGVTRHPLVVINHGTSDATRLAVAMPVYYWLSRWFVERGYAVVLPQRRGHGATGGPMVEAIGSCSNPDHYQSGLAAADDIGSTVSFMSEQPFVAPGETIVLGISSGGWASLALASQNPGNVRAVINIAGGRGGHPFGKVDGSVCGEKRLIDAARSYGAKARLPTLWLYASNDSYFRPDLARAMASAWHERGGDAELHVFPPYGSDGHTIADDRAGWDIWGTAMERFLTRRGEAPVAALNEPPPAPIAMPDVTPVEATPDSSAETDTVTASDGETREAAGR
ncbi:alpha/beta hydrolase family protein [Hyphomicrobium sp.]|uniref:alpha/beta hydrolase family protein n=1 Tax=Hyphomicrobium sp. TaxID=82 RepID=UPI002E3129DA|nr:alpha/beta hydrolase [Hyphomicrobium sp.]HEX2839753.1 alpha/beta hydrolase [Hyphomicrobium sp.]